MSNNGNSAHTPATFKHVERDIAFLQERLELMQRQSKQNKALQKTYRNMLDCRLSVRALLAEKYSNLDNSDTAAFVAGYPPN
tara:strand:+ start:919 stop:1164 length:246 start_codon:yes stop_codon:yes gene_type:complete